MRTRCWPRLRSSAFMGLRAADAMRRADCRPLRSAWNDAFQTLARGHGLIDGGLGERRHDFVNGIVRIQPVFAEPLLKQAAAIDHGVEVVEVIAVGGSAVGLHPLVDAQYL